MPDDGPAAVPPPAPKRPTISLHEYDTAGKAILAAAGYALNFQHYVWIISPSILNGWAGLGMVGGTTTWINYGTNAVNTTSPSAPNTEVNTDRLRWTQYG